MANDNDNIQAYHVRGKVSKVRFVTPASYADGSVFAVTGTWDEEQDNTLSLHQIFRTLQPFPTSQFNPFRTKSVTDVKHEGEVRDLHFLSHDLFLTASSLGRINLFRIAESDPKTQSDTTHKIKLEYSNTTHGSDTGRPLAATGIAVEPNNDMNPEIASVGEDGRLVCFRIEENQNDIAVAIYLQEQIDAAVINGISWPTSKEIIVVTSGGQLKKFDRRDLRKSAAVAVDQDYAADSLTAVACNPSQITQIAVGSSSGLVTVWDSKNLSKPLKQFQVHRANGMSYERANCKAVRIRDRDLEVGC
ncbi:1210_t:CDS:2 [Paraglomus occultum]|uniref:1210_t:CDS:1 n=1 Tax=Paraglomus occultum TaxID=144539 RepID=A0A9N8W2Q2_9GLOM|nr:1210_t:CDS:2 [Paraglomus occultum]